MQASTPDRSVVRLLGRILPFVMLFLIVTGNVAGNLLAQKPRSRPDRTESVSPLDIKITELQQGKGGYTGCQDTGINEEEADLNMHDWSSLHVRSSDKEAFLIRFDLSPIPETATVEWARVEFYALWSSNPLTLGAAGYEVLCHWNLEEATWNRATQDTEWNAPGCNGIDTDRSGDPWGPMTLDTVNCWHSLDITTLVQTWHRQPETNKGVIIKSLPGPSVEYSFASSDHTEREWRPRLIVLYESLEGTETPTDTKMPSATLTDTGTPGITPTETPQTPVPVCFPLILKLGPTPTPTQSPSPTPICRWIEEYDDGIYEVGIVPNQPQVIAAVFFDGISPEAVVVKSRYFVAGTIAPVELLIYDSSCNILYSETVTPSISGRWHVWDLSAQDITGKSEYYVGFRWLQASYVAGTLLGKDKDPPCRQRSYLGFLDEGDRCGLALRPEGNYAIQLCVR